MDKILAYKDIIKGFLETHKGFPNEHHPLLQDIISIDESEQHFSQLTIGWDGEELVCEINFHFELKENGALWIYENQTDIDLEESLTDLGIHKNDIVFAWLVESKPISVGVK